MHEFGNVLDLHVENGEAVTKAGTMNKRMAILANILSIQLKNTTDGSPAFIAIYMMEQRYQLQNLRVAIDHML